MKTKPTYGWHFTSDKLRDGRPIPPINEWLVHKGDVIPCEAGLHASPTPFDALQYAPASVLHFVELRGTIIKHGSPVKLVASERRIIASVDVTSVLWAFARQQALSVAHLWEAPDIVLEYLFTGDEALRDAARDAAWAAASAAARDAAWDAARDAARDAASAAARVSFDKMIRAAFANTNAAKYL